MQNVPSLLSTNFFYYCKIGFYFSILSFGASIICIKFIDKPLTLYIYTYTHSPHFNQHLLQIANYVTEYASIIFIGIYLWVWIKKLNLKLSARISSFIYLSLISFITLWIKNKLKLTLGRNWPQNWAESGPNGSLINNNKFGFNFSTSNQWVGSCPSGHITFLSMSIISIHLLFYNNGYPLKTISHMATILIMITMTACLVILNYHYLGDCLAGLTLGSFISYYGIALYTWIENILKINKI
jgi:membrane-associated phospholipid phosphatase